MNAWVRRGAALALGIVAAVWVSMAQRDTGLVRDEITYINAGRRYSQWWTDYRAGKPGIATEAGIAKVFGGAMGNPNNPEHPPLMKLLFGYSERLLHGSERGPGYVRAARAPNAVLFGVLVALVVLFGGWVWGTAEGVVAGVLMLLSPRMIFHASIACFDAPVVTLWFACVVAYYVALERRWWFIAFGVLFGLMLATKHNAIMLPAVMFCHYAWVAWRHEWKHGRDRGGIGGALRTAALGAVRLRPTLLISFVVIGPVVLIALWPWLWFDTWAHLSGWIKFHLEHVHYNFEYLGDNWNAPPFPWHVAIVTTLFTVPVATLVAGAMGAWVLAGRARAGESADPDRAPVLLLLLSAAVAVGPFFLGSTPIFGAEKHWAPMLPSLCLFAGVGVVAMARRAAATLWGRDVRAGLQYATIAVVGAAMAAAAAAETVDAQPYALTHYNALAGGAPGGADHGMNRQFWGYSARGVLPWLNERAPAKGEPPARVYSHDASPAWGVYKREGLLAPGLPDAGREVAGIRKSKYALVIHELHFNRHDYLIWKAYGTVKPVFVLRTDGVPIVTVYERP